MSRRGVYMQLVGREMLVVTTARSGGKVRVLGVRAHEFASGAIAADANEVGNAAGEQLRELGVARASVTVALPRGVAMAWRTEIKSDGLSDGELVAAARIQLANRSVLDAEEAGVAVDRGGDADNPMAIAIPGERLGWWREAAAAGGFRIGRVTLRAFGLAAFVPGPATIVLDRSAGGGEDVVAQDQTLVYSGALGVGGRPANSVDEGGTTTGVVATRTRTIGVGVHAARTIEASAAIAPDVRVQRALLVIEHDGDELVQGVADRLELPAGRLETPGSISWRCEASDRDLVAVTALVGLALRDGAGLAVPDMSARPRVQRRTSPVRAAALLTMMGVVGILGGMWAAADAKTRSLDSEIERTRTAYQKRAEQVRDHYVMDARLAHAERWVAAGPSLLGHLAEVREQLPGPEGALLDEVSVSLDAAVVFERGESRPYPGTWRTDVRYETAIAGEAASRDVATRIRRDLLDSGALALETSGPDKGRGFRYQMTTRGGAGDRARGGE